MELYDALHAAMLALKKAEPADEFERGLLEVAVRSLEASQYTMVARDEQRPEPVIEDLDAWQTVQVYLPPEAVEDLRIYATEYQREPNAPLCRVIASALGLVARLRREGYIIPSPDEPRT